MGSAPRIVGPATGPTAGVLAAGTRVIGVRLRPGAAPSVLRMPATELVDASVGAREVWELGLDGEASSADAVALLEQSVMRRLAEGPEPDPAVAELVRRMQGGRVDEVGRVAAELFLSERQMRRRCEAAVGLSPKALQRVLRFQRFLALSRTFDRPSTRLAQLASAAGYADQAHLTRESMRLQGQTPRTLLLESERNCARQHDHGASFGPLLEG